MTLWFLAFLAIAWIVVYLPAAWRARQTSPLPAAQRFKRRMRLISPHTSAGRWVVVPGARDRSARVALQRAQLRRKAILLSLVAISLGTAVWALINGSGWEINLVADAATAFYATLLLDAKRRRSERALKVRALKREATPVESEYFEVIEAGSIRH